MEPPEYHIDWGKVASMVNGKTRLIIINSPHNPTGTVLGKSDMECLSELVMDKEIYILSDEVYEHLIYDDLSHQSILKYPELYSRSAAVFSFGKTFHTTGWKMGYIVAPDELTAEFRKIHQWNVFCVNSFLQYSLADYLQDQSHYNYLNKFYEEKRDYLRNQLATSRFSALKCDGTYFQLYDYSSISDKNDLAFSKWLTEEHGVASIPVSVFYSLPRKDKLIRFCFAKKLETLDKAGKILNKI